MVDGSHVVGSQALDIPSLGCQYYAGNLHKWLCTPKGAALLWVHPSRQGGVRPAVTSHGYRLVRVLTRFAAFIACSFVLVRIGGCCRVEVGGGQIWRLTGA